MLGMHGTKTSNFGVSECDLLIVAGARFSDRVTGNASRFAKNAKIIQIDVDAAEINKNIKVDCSIIGDVKEVLKELPDKIEQNMILPFSDEEEKIYVANLAKVNEELQQLYDIEGSDKMQILKMLTRLRQLCLEPRLVYDNIDQPSSKLKACMELIKTMQENKQKVLLFSSFTSALDLIAEECQKAGITYYMLTGSTNKEERRELVSRFQKDDTTLFLISLKAGGTGLNLTSAENVIHYDPWWNVSAQNQATDRAYRIGQKSNVQVFNLVMKDSVEEKIIEMQKRKKELADMFVENNSGGLSQMSKEDILSLFTM